MSKELNERLTLIKKVIDKKESFQPNLYIVPKSILIDKYRNSTSDNQVINDFISETKIKYSFDFNPEISDKEAKELVSQIKDKFDSQRLTALIDDCKSSVLDSIIKPFGLAGVLFEDKTGGNVDTIHNVRNKDKKYNNGEGIYATEKNKIDYENRADYDSVKRKYHSHKNYINKNREASERKDCGDLEDAYSGTNVKRNDKVDLDHTISAKKIHDDPGRVLADLDGPDLACADSNLNITNKSVNTSKGADNVDDFVKRIEVNREKRQSRISQLNDKIDLSQKEEKELNKLNKLEEVDVNTLKQKDKEARQAYENKINKTYYTSKEFVTNVGKTSAKEGVKMGMQQSIGIIIREFALAVFSETEDIFSKRHDIKLNAEFLHSLKERFERISNRVMSKWKDVIVSFGTGTISGFFSNIITVIINSFLTTSKRAVKMIREGFFSLLKALKMLFFAPENMTKEEAAHEATKLIASGLIITGGIAIEEILHESLKTLESIPVIGELMDSLVTVVVGIVTGLSMAFVVYLIDKIDWFNVNANKLQQYISNELDQLIDKNLDDYDENYNYIASTLGI